MPEQIFIIGNCVVSFLQRLAVRGDLLGEEQGVSLDRQMDLLKEMVNIYFDRLVESWTQNKGIGKWKTLKRSSEIWPWKRKHLSVQGLIIGI